MLEVLFTARADAVKSETLMELADERMYRVKQEHHDKDAFNDNQIANEN